MSISIIFIKGILSCWNSHDKCGKERTFSFFFPEKEFFFVHHLFPICRNIAWLWVCCILQCYYRTMCYVCSVNLDFTVLIPETWPFLNFQLNYQWIHDGIQGLFPCCFIYGCYSWPLHSPKSAPRSFSQATEPPTRHPSSDPIYMTGHSCFSTRNVCVYVCVCLHGLSSNYMLLQFRMCL